MHIRLAKLSPSSQQAMMPMPAVRRRAFSALPQQQELETGSTEPRRSGRGRPRQQLPLGSAPCTHPSGPTLPATPRATGALQGLSQPWTKARLGSPRASTGCFMKEQFLSSSDRYRRGPYRLVEVAETLSSCRAYRQKHVSGYNAAYILTTDLSFGACE